MGRSKWSLTYETSPILQSDNDFLTYLPDMNAQAIYITMFVQFKMQVAA